MEAGSLEFLRQGRKCRHKAELTENEKEMISSSDRSPQMPLLWLARLNKWGIPDTWLTDVAHLTENRVALTSVRLRMIPWRERLVPLSSSLIPRRV